MCRCAEHFGVVYMMNRIIYGFEFVEVGSIRLDSDDEMPQSRYRQAALIPLHKFGQGPFCRFSVAKGWRKGGVYALMGGDHELYFGQCQDLETRWGPMGYGAIQPRNCFKGGQETNCRINNLILNAIKRKTEMTLWFLEVGGGKQERLAIEGRLIGSLNPPWNR